MTRMKSATGMCSIPYPSRGPMNVGIARRTDGQDAAVGQINIAFKSAADSPKIVAHILADRLTSLPANMPAAKIEAPQRLKCVFDSKCFVSVCINDTPWTPLGESQICCSQCEAIKTTWLSLLKIPKIVTR